MGTQRFDKSTQISYGLIYPNSISRHKSINHCRELSSDWIRNYWLNYDNGFKTMDVRKSSRVLGPLGSWIPKGPRSSRVLTPLGSWVLQSPGSFRVLGPLEFSRVLGPCFPVCLMINQINKCHYKENLQMINFNNKCEN